MSTTGASTDGALKTCGEYIYKYFGRYFFMSEVGERWAMFNNLFGFFVFCVGLVYAAKPWGLTKWNRNVVKNKRRLRALAFRKLSEEFSQASDEQQRERRRISELTFKQLQDELKSGRISARNAVDAFRWKAMECQEKYNCVTEFVKEAPSWAAALDKTYEGREKPALFGIPFSVKENLCLMGYDCSKGLAKELEWPVKKECSLVSHLRSLGAIPIVRTNVPQTLVSFMCSNPAYGTTMNPFDITRSPGGSSGGEACLIASGGCPFGVGSDMAGSLRIPAHFCGTTTLKPSSGRLKVTGIRPALPGVAKLGMSFGFSTKDSFTQSILFQSTLVPEYFARVPSCAPLPFQKRPPSADRARLRIGYYTEDGWFPSVPACSRAVLKVKEQLESIGHELIPFTIPQPDRAMPLILKCLLPDNGAYWLDTLKYEDVDNNLKMTKRLMSVPLWIRGLASWIMGVFDKKCSLVIGAYTKNLADLRGTFEDVDAYIIEFTEYWKQLELDAVIGTVLPFPAVPHEYPTKLSHAVFGTGIYNLMDMPAGVLQVDKVSKTDEEQMKEYPTKESANRLFEHPVYKMVRKAMQGSEGLPVCVQVIALPYQEEMCLRIMQQIEGGKLTDPAM